MRSTTVRRYTKHSTKGKAFPVRKHTRVVRGQRIYIPPAWKNVKTYNKGPFLAKGYDEKGRPQYVYSEAHIKRQQEEKFERIEKLEKKMPKVLNSVVKDAEKGNQEAQVVYTMYKTGFRPGTDKDTKGEVEAVGALTLEKKNVDIKKDRVRFKFTGKKGVKVDKEVKDIRLARMMHQRKKDKMLFNTNEYKVRDYFKDKTGDEFKLKDLRTLKAAEVVEATKGDRKEIIKAVATELDNTPSVAAGSYINPEEIK